jgi:hypothetical protein
VVGAGEDRCYICPSFCAGKRARPCTRLLYDPEGTLRQQRRWPDHMCYSEFMERSIERWISQAVGRISPRIKLWAERYPLPIGEVAARRLYTERQQSYPEELTRVLPFKGSQEAYWALRVRRRVKGSDAVLDMAALKDPWSETFGAFAYSLRGYNDTSLAELLQAGQGCWDNISWEKIEGRPRGSGATWETPEELEKDVAMAIRALGLPKEKARQREVAKFLWRDVRTLRRWYKRFYGKHMTWSEFLRRI